ncbi:MULTISPECIES: IS66 family insertion sequence element accessory protein TnpA [Ectobacillus]|uniref:IS66 family insertion sequence element accessory protein TnpA n=1 Tax=Ectobacillus TaxID=2837502 RepID=UPI000F5B0121|nr:MULTISPECIES: hypothetical protein [Ectobacillus]UOY92325.1 IS66 family insertion sequence element accessory protein TnpB [Ectobacillus sp. JY-23]
MSIAERKELWSQRIQDFRNSGQTQAAWCEANEVSLNQLKYWLKQIPISEKQANTSGLQWVKVSSVGTILQEEQEILRITVGAASVEVKPGFTPSFLADVVRTLHSLC